MTLFKIIITIIVTKTMITVIIITIIIIIILIIIIFRKLFFKTLLKTWKIWHSLFALFWVVIAAQGVISNPRVRKGVIKLRQIINKHKKAFIPSAT